MDKLPLGGGIQLINDPVNIPGLKPEYHDVVVVGAGFSGIGISANLKRKLGITDVVVIERQEGPAGTWEANTYPGCACDIPAVVYSLSFRQKQDWSGFFVPQPEIREYLRTVVAELGLTNIFHYRTVAKEARYDDVTGLWHVVTETLPDPKNPSAEPERHYYVSKMFYMAVGGLSEPNACNIPGHENFKGDLFHSARWDHSVSLKNKNVIVVGNGCSATQFVPIIAEEAKHVTQFVRSKHWYMKTPKNPLAVIPGWEWLMRHSVIFMYFTRIIVWFVLESHFSMALMNAWGQYMRNDWENQCRKNVKENAPEKYWDLLLPKDNELLAACRRRIIDSTYLPALHRENLDLEPSKLVKIEEDAVITEDGRRLPADVIVMANGFNTTEVGFPLKLKGRDMLITEHYEKYGENNPIAYHQTLNHGFPNLVLLVGPNSGTGHMSVVYTSERQQEFSIALARPVLLSPRPSDAAIAHKPGTPAEAGIEKIPTFEVTLKAELDEQSWIVHTMKDRVFTRCDSWYRNGPNGRVTAVYPDWQWRLALRAWFPVWKDIKYTGLPEGKTRPDLPFWQWLGSAIGLGSTPYVSPEKTPEINRAAMGA
ncbi:hypothetical protein MCUN1_003195 [Malassezia cuniculi]|uniref:FAD/NAD(P)-binding domain-containing protein n=1 Tax=Malassezia cuniculi TaxID=948313 RepID=A0AAF0JCW1_9BASI|nr:hypothetical protein MCUN1_003195 [Malassezia cuniculi]